MIRIFSLGLTVLFLAAAAVTAADEPANARAALQSFNAYIGNWTGDGKTEAAGKKKETWAEKMEWSWRFKGDDTHLDVQFKDGKNLKSGKLRWLGDKKLYQFAAVDASGKEKNFEGKIDKNYLVLEHNDPAAKEIQQIKINIAGDGVRFILAYGRKPEGRTIVSPEFKVSFNKDGENLGGAPAKKAECIVSGGLATMPVTHKGKTYFVCCTGCRDAFNENPEKYIAEFEAKKGK